MKVQLRIEEYKRDTNKKLSRKVKHKLIKIH